MNHASKPAHILAQNVYMLFIAIVHIWGVTLVQVIEALTDQLQWEWTARTFSIQRKSTSFSERPVSQGEHFMKQVGFEPGTLRP